jgi:hypothetical protein
LKAEKVKEKVDKRDFNFEGAKLLLIDFSKREIEGDVNFSDVVIIISAWFGGAEIGGNASFDEAEIGGDAWFFNTKIGGDAGFGNAKIGRKAWFVNAKIGENAWFDEAEIGGNASFGGAEIGGDASFFITKIGGDAGFVNAKIGGNAWFGGAEIGGNASFDEAEIGGAGFVNAKIGGNASFDEAEIGGDAWFDEAEIGENASFGGAEICSYARFDLLEIKGKLSFRDAIFEKPEAQEESCRKAKRVWEEFGDRIEVDYYFYREMEAKRKQKYLHFSLKELISKLMVKLGLEKLIRKHIEFFEKILKQIHKLGLEKLLDKHKEIFGKERRIYWGFLELPVQYIFGYGVHPLWVIGWWFLTVLSLAFVYWIGNGVLVGGELEVAADSFGEYFYFSVVTAATPGYGGYKPVPGFYQALASFEAIFGTFMWAAFIATFARKYMR